jgi:hypothetical protein
VQPLFDEVLTQVVEQGAATTSQIPFRPYTLAALLLCAWVILYTDRLVESWREYTAVYPSELKRNIIHHSLPVLADYTGVW